MSTRTERVFAAFQGPVLSVGSPVLHMYRSYTAELLLPLRWRRARSLSVADVLAALSRATVRAQASALSPPLRCASCGDVVALGHPQTGPEGLPDDLECYSAALRTQCTSSRRHLGAEQLVLGVALAGALVCSERFVVFSREPGRQALAQGRRGLGGAESVDSGLLPPPDASGAALAVCDSPPGPPQQLVVVVEVLRPKCRIPPYVAAAVPGVAEALKRVPGFVLQKCSVMKEMVIFVRAFRTVQDAEQGCEVCVDYAMNVITNAVNRDITVFVQLLARFRNM
eukprot:m51a1_g7151 hypothetical protein (283) ;mRNA; r:334583-335629